MRSASTRTDLRPVRGADGAAIAQIAALAAQIWPAHYQPIIGAAQVAYMLERFQSPAAIAAQIAQGMRYFLIERDQAVLGYLAWEPRGQLAFLSKLYVRATARRQGLARCAVEQVAAQARAEGLAAIELTVNRRNDVALAAYARLGFAPVGDEVQDIGGGYAMDDHRLRRSIGD
jgi:ribosomal protein S18 acetylase RimI-like enzyme